MRMVPSHTRLLLTSTTAAATANFDFTMPADWVPGGSFYFDVTAASGTSPTLDFAIRRSLDNATAYAVNWRTAQISTAADYELSVLFAPGATSDTDQNYGRVGLAVTGGVIILPAPVTNKMNLIYTIGGTNPSFTFSIYFTPYRVPEKAF